MTNPSVSCNSTRLMGDHEQNAVHQLEEELNRLRESTRNVLQKSWDEVEYLQRQCAISKEMLAQHDQERVWHARCINAEKKLQEITEQKYARRYRNSWPLPKRIHPWTDENDKQDNRNKLDLLENDLKLSSRDDTILSLEHTLKETLKHMQNTLVEMNCHAESQRIKEKKIHESHAQKEEHLETLVKSLREKLTKAVSGNEDED